MIHELESESRLEWFFLRIMATDPFKFHPYENRLHLSLQVAMKSSECVGMTCISNLDVLLTRTQTSSMNPLIWVNHKNELFSFAFPATLDLTGKYTQIEPYFSLSDDEQVSFFSPISSFLW